METKDANRVSAQPEGVVSERPSSASATDEFGGTRAREARQVRRQAASGTTSGIEHFKKH